MALLNVFDYKMVTTAGTYTAGDVVRVYYDTTLDALQVNLNSTQIFTGTFLGLDGTDLPESEREAEADYYLLQNFSHVHCEGVIGIGYVPNANWPFAVRTDLGTVRLCETNGDGTNDLTIVVTDVTNATTASATDAVFTVRVGGTNTPLKLSLNEGFDYVNEGQTSTTFSGLTQGTYTVYVKDSIGNVASAPVFIGVTSTYVEKYNYTWKDLEDWQGKVQIYQLDYVGSTTELDAGSSPFVLNYSQSDKFDPIFYSYASLGFLNTKAQGDFYFQEFFTARDLEYKIVFSLDTGAGLVNKWTGFVRAGLYQEPYADLPYEVSLEAVDGMVFLKEEEFLGYGGGQYFNRISQLEAIRNCLDKLSLGLDIRVGINIFEDAHDQDLDGSSIPQKSVLEQTYVDTQTYINEGGIDSCYTVLMKNLKSYAARIFQYEGKWWIVSQLDTDTAYNYVDYDFEGTYSANGSYDPVLNWRSASESTRVVSINRDNNLSISRPYGKINYIYHLYRRDNLLQYGNFERDLYLGTEGNQIIAPILSQPSSSNIVFSYRQGYQSVPVISDQGEGWALIKAGESSNVNVTGRVVGDRGVGTLRGGKGDSYLLHNNLTIRYGVSTPSNTIRVKYVYKIDSIAPFDPIQDSVAQLSEPPFVMLKFRIKIGGDWLQSGEGKTGGAYDIKIPATKFYEFQTIEFQFGAPEVTGFTEKDVEIRLISTSAKEDVDTLTKVGLKSISTLTEPTGLPVVWRDSDTSDYSTGDTLRYYLLEERTQETADNFWGDLVQTELEPGVVQPDDYNATTNPREWVMKGSVQYDNCRSYDILHIDEFRLDLLPKGETAPEDQMVTFVNDDKIKSDYNYDLYHADLPLEEGFFLLGEVATAGIWGNAKAQYRSYFTLADGTPTANWTQTGESLNAALFQILRGYVSQQLARGRWKVSGTLKNDIEIKPSNVIYAVTQNEYTYLPLMMSIDYAHNQVNIDMEEIDDNIDASDNSAFTLGYTIGYES